MKKKSLFPFLTLFCALAFAVYIHSTLFAQVPPPLTPVQLSDHEQTVYGEVRYPTSAATQNATHLAWIEPVSIPEPFAMPDTWSLFYRQLPDGTLINLTASANASGYASYPFIQPGENENVCVVWRDQILSGDYHLFLWNSALNTITRSPSPVNDTAAFTYLPFTCDVQNDAKVVWYSKYSNTEISLWDLATNQQKRISNNSNVTIHSLHMTEINDVLYLAWPELGNIYLWDSVTETAQEIDGSGYASSLFMYNDKNDVIHMFWLRAGFMGPPCHRYWNSVDQTNELLMACDDWDISVVKDGVGNVHAAWVKSNPIIHWNATDNITNTISYAGSGVHKINLIPGPDDRIHIFWQDFVTNSLYYWNSADKVQKMVTSASFYIQNEQRWAFDSTGMLHTVWGDGPGAPNDGNVAYWNPSLSAPYKLTNAPIIFPTVAVTIDKLDKAHVVYGQYGQGSSLQYWNQDMAQPTTASAANFSELDGFTAANGDVFALFHSSNDLYYWSMQEGLELIGPGEHFSYIKDGNESIYLYWVAKGGVEQEDMYAAWDREWSNSVYLPLVVSD